MNDLQLTGPIANVFTAFRDDGAFDPAGQKALFQYLQAQPAITAYFVRSGMGQMYTFLYDEVVAMVELAAEVLTDRPFLAGCSGIWDRDPAHRPDPEVYVRQAVDLSHRARDLGAAATVHVLPEALGGGDASPETVTRQYFERIVEAVAGPVFIYQPPLTAPEFRLTPALIRELADLPGVIGAKLSTNDAFALFELAYAVRNRPDFAFVAGAETSFYPVLCMGGQAVIGQGSCMYPEILAAVQARFEAGDMEGARAAQHAVNVLVATAVNPVAFLKRYATEQGYPVGVAARTGPGGMYAGMFETLSDVQYEDYKALLENERAAFA